MKQIWNADLSNQIINSWSSYVTEMEQGFKDVSYLLIVN